MNPSTSPLLIDLYQLSMIQADLGQEQTETAVLEVFLRHLTAGRNFLSPAGLDTAVAFLDDLSFASDDIDAAL